MSNILMCVMSEGKHGEGALVNVPFGGGLTSVSPCWFELSDCPDCSEREREGMVSQVDRCLDNTQGEGAG